MSSGCAILPHRTMPHAIKTQPKTTAPHRIPTVSHSSAVGTGAKERAPSQLPTGVRLARRARAMTSRDRSSSSKAVGASPLEGVDPPDSCGFSFWRGTRRYSDGTAFRAASWRRQVVGRPRQIRTDCATDERNCDYSADVEARQSSLVGNPSRPEPQAQHLSLPALWLPAPRDERSRADRARGKR